MTENDGFPVLQMLPNIVQRGTKGISSQNATLLVRALQGLCKTSPGEMLIRMLGMVVGAYIDINVSFDGLADR
jgi:hypothetical protein